MQDEDANRLNKKKYYLSNIIGSRSLYKEKIDSKKKK